MTVIFGRRCETRDYFRTGGSIIPPRATKCESSSFRVSSDRDAWASSEGLISTYGKQCHVENFAEYVRNGTIYFLRVSVFVRFDRLEKWRKDFHFFFPHEFFEGTAVGINNIRGVPSLSNRILERIIDEFLINW